MATTYGAPTNLDLSACSVTATGGTTSQTLADMGKAVEDNATAVASAQSAATSAADTASSAVTAAQAATNAINDLGNTYIPQTAYMKPGGTVKLDQNAQFTFPPAWSANQWINFGYILNSDGTTSQDPNCGEIIMQYSISGRTSGTILNEVVWGTGVGSAIIYKSFSGTAFHSGVDGASNLGMADHAWGNIYSKTAVQVTSDINQKTVIGSLGDTSYADGQKLADALFGLDTTMFQLNASIAEKGAANARLHAGFIAQTVQAAITNAGLDPAKYALWTNSPVYETTEVDTGKKDSSGNPITTRTVALKKDAQGNQVYTQMLRYEQILCVLFEAAKAKITAQESALSALTARVAALEAKAGA
ncbi:tail fiber domain-containing protein [Acetobacter sp. A11-2]|uniref:tail fiber domain-containing protein n=1 Tax=Acetobacter sp. A11-2 TaxID=3157859 RepID=UPI0032F061D1